MDLMMLRLTILFLFFSSYTLAQRMNAFGHFESTQTFNKIPVDSIFPEEYKASRIIETKSGYIILPGGCETPLAVIRVLDKQKNELLNKQFRQIVNLTFSPDHTYCLFYDLEKIIQIDLTNGNLLEYRGSSIYAINDLGQAVYCSNDRKSVVYRSTEYPVEEQVNRILFWGEEVLLMTAHAIYKFEEFNFIKVISFNNAKLFDWGIFENKLHFSVKTSTKNYFIFNEYYSDDLLRFKKSNKIETRRTNTYRLNNLTSPNQSVFPVGELIRCPLDFFNDTVYQAVGNSYGEYQQYGSIPYLHPGVDLMGVHLQDVHAVKRGLVRAIITTADTFHWRIAISNLDSINTFGYLYAHLDLNTIPFQVGDTVEEGDVIGKLVNFPVQGFVHCHFAKILDTSTVWVGGWWTLDNPLAYMTNFFDTVPPVFQKSINNDVFAFRNSVTYLSPDSLYGKIKVISMIHDLINSNWEVDVNTIRYNLSEFNTPQNLLLDSFSYAFNFYTDVYFSGSYNFDMLNTIYSVDTVCQSAGNYNQRQFYHIVTNSDGDDTLNYLDSTVFFDTRLFPDGDYIFRVNATDASGNTSQDSMVIRIRNQLSSVSSMESEFCRIYPNPTPNGHVFLEINRNVPVSFELFNGVGKKCGEGVLLGSTQKQIQLKERGLYLLRFSDGIKSYSQKIVW